WASYPADYSSVTFHLRKEARWHDGTPITPVDVIYSLDVNKTANPRMGLYYKNVARAEATGDNEVTFYFDVNNNRDLPMIMGPLTEPAEALWEGEGRGRQSARPDEDDARAAARLRPLPHQAGHAWALDHLRARRRLLGQGPAGE